MGTSSSLASPAGWLWYDMVSLVRWLVSGVHQVLSCLWSHLLDCTLEHTLNTTFQLVSPIQVPKKAPKQLLQTEVLGSAELHQWCPHLCPAVPTPGFHEDLSRCPKLHCFNSLCLLTSALSEQVWGAVSSSGFLRRENSSQRGSWESMEYVAGVEEMLWRSTDLAELQPACLRVQPCFPKPLLSAGAWLVLKRVTRRLGP